jgi:hypothetical protein
VDSLSARGASAIATKIQVYWITRGLTGVRAWAEPIKSMNEEGKEVTVFQVRSNVVELVYESAYRNAGIQQPVS